MFALLGEVQFEIVGSPESFVSSRRYDYAVHRVLQDRPKLQWVAPGLEMLRFELLLHQSFTDPAADAAALIVSAEAHQVLPLIFGNGDFRGNFVITQLTTVSQQLSGDGRPIAIRVEVELLEWAWDLNAALSGGKSLIAGAVSGVQTLLSGPVTTPGSSVAPGLSPLIALSGPIAKLPAGMIAEDVPVDSIVRKAS